MSSGAQAGRSERVVLTGHDRVIDRLSRELTCLVDLGALTAEEEDAFSETLGELRAQAALARSREAPADTRPEEPCRTARLLAVDLDLAYQRLGSGV